MTLATRASFRKTVVSLWLWTACAGYGLAAQPIVFLGDRDLAPYEFIVNGVPRGANVDLARAVGRVLGREVDVQLMDWAEAQRRLLEGQGDVLTLMVPTPERERLHDFTQPTMQVAFSLFVRADDRPAFSSRSVESALEGRRVGVTKGGGPRLLLEPAHPKTEFVLLDNQLDGTRRLVSGQIDALAATQWSQEFLLAELGLRGVVSLPPFAQRGGAMAVRKGEAALVADLDRALTEIKRSGEFDQIIERWSTTKLQLVSERTLVAAAIAAGVVGTALVLLSAGLIWSRRQRRALEHAMGERVKFEQELMRAQEGLRQADRRKDEFIAMLGHELRNPLAPLTTAAALIERKGSDSPQGRWALDTIRRQIRLMVRLIDDLLDVGRLTSGKLTLQVAPVALNLPLSDAIEAVRPQMESQRHAFTHEWPEDEIWVAVDRARLTQIVANLLTNAAKYTPESGRVHLLARLDGDDLEIRVEDNGVGIAAGQLERLFQMFAQEERSRPRSGGGLGIGLWLTRQIVQLHHGSIEARSAGAGRGSTFIVRLPKVRCAPAAPAAATPSPSVSSDLPAHGLRVVVADDSVDNAEAIGRLLRTMGCTVEVAADGVTALDAVQRLQPQMVLLDVCMPGMDGLEVCRRLRAQGWGSRARIVAMSGRAAQADRAAAEQAGFDEHLAKPLGVETIERLLRSVSAVQPA